MRFGIHLSIAGGVHKAALEAKRLGLDCLQIFSGSPRGWKQRPFRDAELTAYHEAKEVAGLDPVVVHAPYLINLASPDEALWRKSIAAMAEQLDRADALGCKAVVVHPGSRGDKDEAWGAARVRGAVSEALELSGGGVKVWLENTCGGGGQLGGRLSILADMLDKMDGAPVGACLDTAHAWGAGYALDSVADARKFLDLVDKRLGLARVKFWHLNDTSHKLGSKRDEHQHLGKGLIGTEGFRGLVCAKRLAGAAGAMETPKDSPWADRRNLAFLRRLAKGCG